MNLDELVRWALEHGTPDCQHHWTVTSACPLCLRGRIVRLAEAITALRERVRELESMPVADEVEAMAAYLIGGMDNVTVAQLRRTSAMLRSLSRQIAGWQQTAEKPSEDAVTNHKRAERAEEALQRIASGTFDGPYANRPAEIAQFAADALKWTDRYSYDKTDNHTRLFCAASDWMDRAEKAEADNAACRAAVSQMMDDLARVEAERDTLRALLRRWQDLHGRGQWIDDDTLDVDTARALEPPA